MRFKDGLVEWCSDLRKIYSTDEVRGLEKAFDWVIFFLMIVTISQLLQFFFWGELSPNLGDGRDQAAAV